MLQPISLLKVKLKKSRRKSGNLVQSKEIEKQSELARGLNHPRPNKTAMSGRKNCGVRAEEKSGGDELPTFGKWKIWKVLESGWRARYSPSCPQE